MSTNPSPRRPGILCPSFLSDTHRQEASNTHICTDHRPGAEYLHPIYVFLSGVHNKLTCQDNS